MTKRQKQRAQARSRSAPVTAQAVCDTGSDGSNVWFMGGSGYQAAGFSANRGYLYWPTTDTRRQMTGLTRNEILRRIQWLLAHFGFALRMVLGPARLLGYVVPQPNTSDDEWNDLAYDALMSIMGNAATFDAAGKFDGLSGQVMDNVSVFSHGDCLAVLTESSTGRARLATYEAHQIKCGPDSSGPGWEDGILKSRQGAHLAYSLQDGEDLAKFTIVDAQDAIYMGHFQNRGQLRALSILTPMVLNMVDVVETRAYTKTSIKRSSQVGTVIEQDMGPAATSNNGGFGNPSVPVNMLLPNGETQAVTFDLATSNGSKGLPLKPGQRIKVVTDERRSPNAKEFELDVLRDCAHAADLPFDALYDLTRLKGPGVRALNSEMKRWIALKRLPQVKRVSRFTIYALAKEMKRGALRQPRLQPGEQWWQRIEYIGMADMDIDGGRTAAATLTDLQSGLTTFLDEHGAKGAFWKRKIRQAINEVVFMEIECAKASEAAALPDGRITPERVFPQRFSIINAQAPELVPVQESQVNQDADTSDEDTPVDPEQ